MTHIKTGVDFDCPVSMCDMQFSQHASLRSHLDDAHAITPSKPASCKRCSLLFANSRRLLLHYQTKHDEGDVSIENSKHCCLFYTSEFGLRQRYYCFRAQFQFSLAFARVRSIVVITQLLLKTSGIIVSPIGTSNKLKPENGTKVEAYAFVPPVSKKRRPNVHNIVAAIQDQLGFNKQDGMIANGDSYSRCIDYDQVLF